jgi:hypothetical protein
MLVRNQNMWFCFWLTSFTISNLHDINTIIITTFVKKRKNLVREGDTRTMEYVNYTVEKSTNQLKITFGSDKGDSEPLITGIVMAGLGYWIVTVVAG